ncbi:MAG: GNAT family N-acetyltransferase [Prolixibacteraceae bacterium]|jgi:GNAT superfamily N-acetyltransferase|nr:GNAT family N-acetyltransferase [Prolixibacteraceae bacterium]HHV25541.1 GNAT family N-acetyltransferase [Methanosarcina sp.]
MIQLKNIETLKGLVSKYFNSSTITNNYILLNDYLQYIAENRLSYVAYGSNVGFLLQKSDFYQLYYYINDRNVLLSFDVDNPITMEILYRGESNKPNEIIEYWERCGFKQHILRVHMVAQYSQMNFFPENEEVIVSYAKTEEEIVFAKGLIENAFDKYTGQQVLTLEDARNLAAKRNILCAYYEGKLCGTITFEIKNNIVVWTSLVVSEGFRGKGVAMKLMQTYFRLNSKGPDTRYTLWVKYDNTAKNIYQRSGFVYDNKFSMSMLKEN